MYVGNDDKLIKGFITHILSMMMTLLDRIALTYLLLTTVSANTYPDCADPLTYASYGKSTEYKGLSDTTAWDRTLDSGDACDFSAIVPPQQSLTCGDCDFDLEDNTWYRFDQGPYVEIAKLPDNSSCPARGHCNGFYQIALLSSDIDSGNVNSKMYYIVYSNATDPSKCIVVESAKFMVEEFYCYKFRLYKFPSGWKSSSACNSTKDDQGIISPTPYSLCMTDTVEELTLTANRMYFTEDNTPLTCTSKKSPTPPPDMTWTDQNGQDITSRATGNSTLSSLFTEVYGLNSSSVFTSVTCQVEDKSHTFYRVSIEAESVNATAEQEVSATCNIIFYQSLPEQDLVKNNIYFIDVLDNSEIFYTSNNITEHGNISVFYNETLLTYRTTLTLHNTTISPNETRLWKCGIRDSISEQYILSSFSLTSHCLSGSGLDRSGSCVRCPANTYSNLDQCQECREGRMSASGASQCVGVEVKDVVARDNEEVGVTCNVTADSLSEDNLYFIEVLEGEVVYYSTKNISKLTISKDNSGTFQLNLVPTTAPVPDNLREITKTWKCGVRDPLTHVYTTVSFTITLIKQCQHGTGYVTTTSNQCEVCPKNTISFKNECRKCMKGQVAEKGSFECTFPKYSGRLSDFFIGIGVVIVGALLIVTVLFLVNYKHHYRIQVQ